MSQSGGVDCWDVEVPSASVVGVVAAVSNVSFRVADSGFDGDLLLEVLAGRDTLATEDVALLWHLVPLQEVQELVFVLPMEQGQRDVIQVEE